MHVTNNIHASKKDRAQHSNIVIRSRIIGVQTRKRSFQPSKSQSQTTVEGDRQG